MQELDRSEVIVIAFPGISERGDFNCKIGEIVAQEVEFLQSEISLRSLRDHLKSW